MFSLFKTVRIYLQLSHNHVRLINLETGEAVEVDARNPFSTERNVVGDWTPANAAIQEGLEKAGIRPSLLGPALHILVQQMEKTEGGLSIVERRALRDLAEHAGGRRVKVLNDSVPRNEAEACKLLGQG